MMSLRGRGGSRGPYRIKLARVVPRQGTVKSDKDVNMYEDKVLCVTDGPVIAPVGKKRGRPKKNLSENLKTLSVNIPNSRKVVYIPSPSSENRTYDILPMKDSINVLKSHRLIARNAYITKPNGQVCRKVKPMTDGRPTCAMPGNCAPAQYVSPMNLTPSASNNPQALTFQRKNESHQPENFDNYPEDLKVLEREYDKLVGSCIWEVVHWLHAPINYESYPRLVKKNHQMVNEIFSPDLDTKLDEVVEWLLEVDPTAQNQPKIIPPKVVVEAQPNHLQDCNQWSSMAENQVREC